jgi:hypothetical protein
MAPTVAVAWLIAFAVLLFAMLRRQEILVPACGETPVLAPPDDDEEQMPETDRTPRRLRWLPTVVAATALVRLVVLVALHR